MTDWANPSMHDLADAAAPERYCGHCGEPGGPFFDVEYDAMVDGPGYMMSEERCARCTPRKGDD